MKTLAVPMGSELFDDDLPGMAVEETAEEAPVTFEGITAAIDAVAATIEEQAAIIEEIAGEHMIPLPPLESESPSWGSPDEPAPEPIPEPPPQAAARNGLALLYEIEEAEKACRRAESEVNNLKELLKSAKEVYEDAVAGLRKIAGNVAGAIEADREEMNLPIFRLIEANLETGEIGIGPDSNVPLTVGLAGDPLALPAVTVPVSDSSVNWPNGSVPSRVLSKITSEIMGIKADDIYAVEFDIDGVFVDEQACLMAGDYEVVEWRDQRETDVIPRFVARYRVSFERKLLQDGDEVELSTPPAQPAPAIDESLIKFDEEAADLWPHYLIEDLELTDSVVKLLHGAGIKTVGDYVKFVKDTPLTAIPGIGATKVAKIDAAVAKFKVEKPYLTADALAAPSTPAPSPTENMDDL